MDKNSPWQYFDRKNDAGICKKCSTTIKAAGGSTSGLHYHLERRHGIKLLKRKITENNESSNNVSSSKRNSDMSIISYFKKDFNISLPAVISRMVVKDGLPFSKFCTSEDIRRLLFTAGYKDLPKSPNSIKKIVLQYGNEIYANVLNEILKSQRENQYFSITCDEWTSIKNRRYLNINVHNSKMFWNVGLCRIHETFYAEKCAELLENKLKELNIPIQQITSIITDGASLMKKVSRIINVKNQLCIAHGIHLAVLKVLYVNSTNGQAADKFNENEDELDDEDENEFGLELQYNNNSDINPLKDYKLELVISKIRKVVKIFRKSSTKNDILQKYIKDEMGKELSLHLDSRTRWNSLLVMLERFLEVKNAVRKSLIDIKADIFFTEIDFEIVSEVVSALQPVKLAVDTLCRKDINLYVADVTLEFMLNEVTEVNSFLSNELKEELIFRIKERRIVYSDLLQYLYNPEKLNKGDSFGIFNNSNKTTVLNGFVELIERQTIKSSPITVDHNESEKTSNSSLKPENNKIPLFLSMRQKLDFIINEKINAPVTMENSKTSGLKDIIRKEMNYFSDHGVKGKYLEIAFQSLLSIRPTSIESERAFSSASYFCTKVRSRLDDESLNVFCFLRSYFNNNK